MVIFSSVQLFVLALQHTAVEILSGILFLTISLKAHSMMRIPTPSERLVLHTYALSPNEQRNMVWTWLGCIQMSVASRSREVILPLSSGVAPAGVLCSALESSVQERHGPVGEGPQEGHKNGQRDETPLCFYEERLRELILFRLKKKSCWGHLIVAFQFLRGVYKKDG